MPHSLPRDWCFKTSLSVLALAGLSSACAAGSIADQPASPAPKTSPASVPPKAADPLAGPSVPMSTRPTLVRRDMHGSVQRLEVFPAQAALETLTLDPATAKAVSTILAERAAILDATVRDNLALLIELFSAGQAAGAGGAGSAGDALDAARIGLAFVTRLRPLIRRGSIEAELASVLPESARARIREMVEEYENAIVAEESTPAQPKPKSRFEVLTGESLRLWGEQIRLSFERQSATGEVFFEPIIRNLKLRPDQETRVRDLIAEYVEETKLQPTKEQERDFGLKLVAWLDPAQTRELLRMIQGYQSMGKKAAERADPAKLSGTPDTAATPKPKP